MGPVSLPFARRSFIPPLSVDLPLQSELHCGMFDEANAHRLLFDGVVGSIRVVRLRYLLASCLLRARSANLSVCNGCYTPRGACIYISK